MDVRVGRLDRERLVAGVHRGVELTDRAVAAAAIESAPACLVEVAAVERLVGGWVSRAAADSDAARSRLAARGPVAADLGVSVPGAAGRAAGQRLQHAERSLESLGRRRVLGAAMRSRPTRPSTPTSAAQLGQFER